MSTSRRKPVDRSHAGLFVAVLMAATGGATALASDDGGTRSLFVYGAGNRALSMGGAFTAVSDDASAAVWNPGGLGLVLRNEFQASRTNLLGLGAVEDYASLVLPSWRFGTASLTVRRLAVGGIEARDERNNVAGEELSSGQTELLLAYGRGLTEALAAGASLKLRRQTLAGYSAGGFGSDLGMVVQPGAILGGDGPWVRDLTLGLSLQNLIPPSLRLDEEAVKDPLTTRAGVAFHRRFGSGGGLLTAVDLEHSQGLQPRLHFGLELSLLPSVAFRAGWRPEAPTAGAALRWHNLSADYLFEDTELGVVHRAGLSWMFGATTEERRLAFRQAEEDALQNRLAEAFGRRQDERCRQLLAEVEAAYQGGNFDQAIEKLGLIRALSPERPDAADWERRCWVAKAERIEQEGNSAEAAITFARALTVAPEDSTARAGLERCRLESDHRSQRSEELRRSFAEALDAFGAGDLVRARREFRTIVKANPEDEEAGAMLRRTERAIEGRVADLKEQSNRYLRGGLVEEADAAIARIRALDSSAQGLAALERSLAEKRRSRTAENTGGSPEPARASAPEANAPARPSARPAISPQQRREAGDLYARGLAAMQAERSAEALRYWELVYAIDPGYQQVRDHLKREYLMVGMDAFADGRLEEAAGLWQKALQLDPDDEKTKGYLARAEQQLSRTREILAGGR